MTAKLSGDHLTLFRGDRCLFKGLRFALNPGELLLLEGPNGSGKTSLLRAIAGLLELESGTVRWNDIPMHRDRLALQNAMVWMSHKVGLKGDLTLVENLRYEAALRPQAEVEFASVLKKLGLNRLTRLPVRSLSAGQQRRVALARLLLSSAMVWLMDEPTANLDSEGRKLVAAVVQGHLANGGMAIIAAHQDFEVDMPVQRISLQ
ncbi:MAG: heme ABC exporter ATP-binding protein CcmA [Gammaproteobacteria bacterium]|nr:heme ABC exporter ATP-binding protein CcmA [Gammaproteobacteria bacterium]MDH5304909.1 heme ABC exporter ATP-binding protein CcmA [Gammaproteobacteria bacterium]MDH5322854.1 heme ABC exporter ATP-binding protein CcmA [Gammaproteobacteria bacterium]